MVRHPYIHLEIPKRGPRCTLGQETFEPSMEYHSVVLTNDGEGLVRQDYCSGCWAHLDRKALLATTQSHWKSIVPPKKAASSAPQTRDEKAFRLLHEALESTDADKSEAFVMALFLARRKLIKACDDIVLDNGIPATLYEIQETEEILCVPKIKLSDLQIETLQASIAQKLKD